MGIYNYFDDIPTVQLNANVFKSAKKIFSCTNEIEYVPVVDNEGNYICHCYEDKHADTYLIHLLNMKSSNSARRLFYGLKFINIYSFNELSFQFYLLCKNSGCKINLFGDLWEYITPLLVEHNNIEAFELYAEGNCGLPINEMGEWKNVFPHNEYVHIEKIYTTLNKNAELYNTPFKSHSEANSIISTLIRTNIPFMASRLGNTESRITQEYLNGRISNYWMSWLYNTSGFYSRNNEIVLEDVNQYAELTIESLKNCDINLCRFENSILLINEISNNNTLNFDWYDLYTHIEQPNFWLGTIRNKKILIVSSINAQIKEQIPKFRLIHNTDYSISCPVVYYDCPETYFKEERHESNWFETFNKIKTDISKIEFDIAIISAGAYGHPLAAYIKMLGKQAINICSGIYVLFGIRNKTQTIIRKISSKYNKYWIFPVKNNNRNYIDIEKGGYWG